MSLTMTFGAERFSVALKLFAISVVIGLSLTSSVTVLGNSADADFNEVTGVLRIPNLLVDFDLYSMELILVDAARLRFKVNPTTARYLGINNGSYYSASFFSTATKLNIARLRVGNQIFTATMNLVDAGQMIFELDLASVRNTGTISTNTDSILNAFSHLSDESSGLPLRSNYFTVTFPANTQSGFPQTTVNVPLLYGQMSVQPVLDSNSLVNLTMSGSTVAFNSPQINCSFGISFVADMAYRGVSSIRLNDKSFGNYGTLTCAAPVKLPGGATWYITITSPPDGIFNTTATVTTTGNTSGTTTMTLNGNGSVTALLSNSPDLLKSSQIQSGSNLDFSVNLAADMTVMPDGSVLADGVLVKPPTTTSSSTSSTSSDPACVNEFTVSRWMSYYSTDKINLGPEVKVKASSSQSPMSGGRVIYLASEKIVEKVPEFRLQLMIPESQWGKDIIDIRDDQNDLGFDDVSKPGAIARLMYSIGKDKYENEVNDSWWTNKDHGSQLARKGQKSGVIEFIYSDPTKIIGTFSFNAYGDGYPSLNNYQAQVGFGKFCLLK